MPVAIWIGSLKEFGFALYLLALRASRITLAETDFDGSAFVLCGGMFRRLASSGDGRTTSVEREIEGKTLVVNVWAEWCGPCREEVPEMNALMQAPDITGGGH